MHFHNGVHMQLVAKSVAIYKPMPYEFIQEGSCALITVVDHPSNPHLNSKEVITTAVERVGNFGVFETKNTTYMPEEQVLPVLQDVNI